MPTNRTRRAAFRRLRGQGWEAATELAVPRRLAGDWVFDLPGGNLRLSAHEARAVKDDTHIYRPRYPS